MYVNIEGFNVCLYLNMKLGPYLFIYFYLNDLIIESAISS